MLKLTFFTSNLAKLAHARYLAERLNISISGFRQRTYHAGYHEPRIESRTKLLRASYESAIRQCERAGINPGSSIFFLEDTSVTIFGLSNKGKEFPGLNIKYWMRDITFQELDQLLKEAGNDRRVEVRSDVVLHIPESFRSNWNTNEEYKVFTGKQKGIVVERELDFETNLVFPWLDSETFNKWFQPDGAKQPLGSLEISTANKFDFRKRSFGEMFKFVSPEPQKIEKRKQLELVYDERPIYVLCGYTCSGKTTASQYISKRYNYQHIEASDFMQVSFYRRHGFNNNLRTSDFAEKALVEKPLIVASQVLNYLEEEWSIPAVISGFRAISEVDHTIRNLEYCSRKIVVVFIEADVEERFQRLKERKRTNDATTLDNFREKDEQQHRMGLENIHNDTRTVIWKNMGSLDDYFIFLDLQFSPEMLESIDLTQSINLFRNREFVKLEDAILVALLKSWKSDETIREYFTTTEIAGMVNNLFRRIQPKHKDNVSRYFNQDFHSYYEVKVSNDLVRKKYRLSNTGYSRALRTIRKS